MPYTVTYLTTVADCDLMLAKADQQKSDLNYRKLTLERQKTRFAETAVEVEAELQASNSEATALDAIIASLPDGDTKDETVVRKRKLELKLFLLQQKKDDFGGSALVEKEFDLGRVNKELEEADAFIAAVTARKAALPQT